VFDSELRNGQTQVRPLNPGFQQILANRNPFSVETGNAGSGTETIG
jgi:hypothetical protein